MGLGNFFKASAVNIKKWLGFAYHWLKPVMTKVGEIMLSMLMDKGLAIIKVTVLKYMEADMPSEEKFKAAKDEIIEGFKLAGLEIKDSLINLAIELFVSIFKNRLI